MSELRREKSENSKGRTSQQIIDKKSFTKHLPSNDISLGSAAHLMPQLWTSQRPSTTTSAAATPAAVQTVAATIEHIHLLFQLAQLCERQ